MHVVYMYYYTKSMVCRCTMQSLLMAGVPCSAWILYLAAHVTCCFALCILKTTLLLPPPLSFSIPLPLHYMSLMCTLRIPHSKRFLQRWSLLMTASPAQESLYKHSLHIIDIPLSSGSLVEHTTLQWSCFQTPHQEWTPTCTAHNQTIDHVRMRCRALDNRAISCKSSAVHTCMDR